MKANAPWRDHRPGQAAPDQRRPARTADLSHLRPASPGQLALVGGGLWIAGMLIPAFGVLGVIGIGLLLVAGLSLLIRPRHRETYWRGRRIELEPPSAGERLYRLIYRR